MLVGPAPFYVAGLIGAVGRGATASAWLVLVAAEITGNASVVAGTGLIGLFPTGRPPRCAERRVLAGMAALAVLLPLLVEMSSAAPPTDLFGYSGKPAIASPLFVPAAHPVEPVVVGLHHSFAAWTVLGVIRLYLRYRRSASEDRRRIRFLLVGAAAAMMVLAAQVALALAAGRGAERPA